MKHRMFKIRNTAQSPQLQEAQKEPDHPLHQLVSLLKTFIQTKPSSKVQSKHPKSNYQVEARDRQVMIDPPEPVDSKIPEKELKLWISDVFKTVCSSAFNYFSKNEMNFQQSKIYCSQNIFKNIVLLSQKYHLSKNEIQMVDNHIKKGVLNYLAAKYPLTDSSEINKKLQAVVKEVDNIESLQNNYFTNSKIVFEYRDSGNYNDLIMQMLNDLMGSIDQLSKEQTSNYQQFQEFMSEMFQKVTDQQWMKRQNRSKIRSVVSNPIIEQGSFIAANSYLQKNEQMTQTLKKISEDKDKYRNKVKEYTHYAIGRKIGQNTPLYTAREIQNDNISIKSPQILRILTKWCEQLHQKYSGSYFSNRSQSVKVQRGQNVNSLLMWMREQLDSYLGIQNKLINQSMNELFSNNYEMQANLLESQLLKQGDQHINFIEKVCGKFSYNVVKNLHAYIIAYLNKLIHGILKVSKEFLERNSGLTDSVWPSPPNLLSFKIGDLMRCKFSSKQKQIIKIYQEINRISRQNPGKLKIVRIKNRLRMGTNDILMNIRFNDKILCEIQLAIISKKSDFIKCSNEFHHYIYQLERSLFGPLTQLCSIWNSLDKRANIYEQLVQQEQNQVPKQHQCVNQNKNFSMNPYLKPFICSKCQYAYTHNRFIKEHTKCSNCNYLLCAKCNIEGQSQQNLKKILGKDKIMSFCGKRILKGEKLPQSGICSLIESKNPKIQLFTLTNYRNNHYLLGKEGGSLYEIFKLKSDKDKQRLRKQYLIFSLLPNKEFVPLSSKEVKNKYIIPLLTKSEFSKQKDSINLMDLALKTNECQQILSLGTRAQKETVKNLFLTDNQIEQLPFKPEQFPNIEWITLSRNRNIKSLNGLQNLQYFRKIILTNCSLKEVPSSIYGCKNINQISFQMNSITQISDKIFNLQSLTNIQFSSNKIKILPQSLFECKKLKSIVIGKNLLTEIPQSIKKLQALQTLLLSSNNITSLPEGIGQLQQLKKIYLNSNKNLCSLPSSFTQLKLIQLFDISETAISDIPIHEEGWACLKQFKAYSTNVKQFSPPFQKTKNVELLELYKLDGVSLENLYFNQYTKKINISFNSLKEMPKLSECKALKVLNISNNKIQTIPWQNLQGLLLLEQFICHKNLLTSLPHSLAKMSKLTRLSIQQNELKTFFSADFQSTLQFGLQLWPNIKQFNLKFNKFLDIPLCVCFHSNVTKLFVQNNQLKRIRPQIKYMKKLNFLYGSTNEIEEIPKEVTQIQKLSYLILKNNKITHIPEFIRGMSKLQSIQVDGCPIQTIDSIDYWSELKSPLSQSIKKIAKQIKQKQQVIKEQVEKPTQQ